MTCLWHVTLSVAKGLTLPNLLHGVITAEYQARDIPTSRWGTQEVIVTLKAVELQSAGSQPRD